MIKKYYKALRALRFIIQLLQQFELIMIYIAVFNDTNFIIKRSGCKIISTVNINETENIDSVNDTNLKSFSIIMWVINDISVVCETSQKVIPFVNMLNSPL